MTGDAAVPSPRVLMLNYEYPPYGGGTGLACAALLEHLARAGGLEIDLVTSGPRAVVERPAQRPGIAIHRVAVAKRSLDLWTTGELAAWSWRAWLMARRLVRTRRYDLLHCWGGWPAGAIGAALPGRLPMLVSMRGSDVPGYNERLARLDPVIFRPLVRRVWQRSAKLLAVSGDLRALALRTWPAAEIEVVPNAIDTAGFAPPPDTPGQRLVFVGRLIPRKSVATLIDGVHLLAARFPRLEVTIVGDGPLRAALEARAAAGPAAGRIRFTGRVERAAVDAILAEADVFVLPSLREAMSNAALEALGAGLAVVTTPTGVAELVDGNGAVVPAGDPAALAGVLAGYCSDPERLLAHRRRSRQLAGRFSLEALTDRYRAIYAELASRRSAAGALRREAAARCAPRDTFPSAPEPGDRRARR